MCKIILVLNQEIPGGKQDTLMDCCCLHSAAKSCLLHPSMAAIYRSGEYCQAQHDV